MISYWLVLAGIMVAVSIAAAIVFVGLSLAEQWMANRGDRRELDRVHGELGRVRRELERLQKRNLVLEEESRVSAWERRVMEALSVAGDGDTLSSDDIALMGRDDVDLTPAEQDAWHALVDEQTSSRGWSDDRDIPNN